MPKIRNAPTPFRGQLPRAAHHDPFGSRRRLTTLGDLVSAAVQVTGSTLGAARLLGESSPLGQLLDRRIIIG
jgi:hypothetical protein